MEMIINAATSVITAVLVTRVLATHYFKIVDGYVKEMCEATEESNKKTLSTVRKLQQNFDREE